MTQEQARRIAVAIYKRDRQMDVLDDWAELVISEWVKIILQNV